MGRAREIVGRRRGSGYGKSPGAGPGSLRPDHLYADLALPRAVELRKDDGLESSKREIAVVDAKRHGSAQQRGPQVRMRVAALAVGKPGVVVAVTAALGHQLFGQPLEIV